MKKLWELDSKRLYLIDECDNIYEDDEEYCNIIQNSYEGIKDGLESWLDRQCEKNLKEMTGGEIIEKRIIEYEEEIEYWKSYYEHLKEDFNYFKQDVEDNYKRIKMEEQI